MNTYLSLAEKLTNDASIEADISSRTTKTYKPKMISLPEGGIGKQNSFFNQGTIVTLVAQGNNEYLSGLAAAIKSKNQSRIQLHCEAIIERTRRDTLQAPKKGGLDDIPVIIDVLYGNTWLAKHMLIAPHTQMALSAAVWSGGKLNDQAFRVLEHKQKKSRMADLEVLTILIPPRLTKIERAVLKAAPADLSDVHVSGPSISWSAAGLALRYTPDAKTVKTDLTLTEIEKYLVPFADKDVQSYTVQQRQQQQADTKQQQQQQQHYTNDGQNHQQQQQQQKQNEGQQQQQQQEQHQNAKTQQQQDQNQQQQQADTKQQQHDNQQQHEANTAQEQEGSLWRDEMNGGFKILPIDETIYSTLLSRIDFQSLDATQSVKELLRLRERLLVIGLG